MERIRRFFWRWLRRERQSDWLFPWEKDGGRYTSCKKWRMFENIDG